MIKYVCFDVGGTLMYRTGGGFCSKVLSFLGVSLDELRPKLEEYFLTKNISYKHAISQFANDTKLDLTSFDWEEFSSELRWYDDALEILALLHENYKLITLSNVTPWEAVKLNGLLPVEYFLKEFTSYEMGYAKPNELAFKYVENYFNLNPSEILIVGDSLNADIVGGKKCGWSTYFVNRLSKNVDEKTSRFVDFESSDLKLLKDVLL